MSLPRKNSLLAIANLLKCQTVFLNKTKILSVNLHTSTYHKMPCITEAEDKINERYKHIQQKNDSLEKEKQALEEKLCDARGELSKLYSLCIKYHAIYPKQKALTQAPKSF